MKPQKSIKVFSFDIWGTILKPNCVFDSERPLLLYRSLVGDNIYIEKEKFFSVFKAIKSASEYESEQSGTHIGWEKRIQKLCANLDLPKPAHSILDELDLKQELLVYKYPPLLIDPQIPKLFSEIHSKDKQIAIISNTGLINSKVVRKFLTRYGLSRYITYCVFSDIIGITKPNAIIFRYLVDQVGCHPQEIVHIGDNKLADYIGARDSGLRAIHTPLDKVGIERVRRLL